MFIICLLVVMASNEEHFNIPLPPEPKKKRVNCFAKCVICQIDRKNETLRIAKESSVQTLIRVINLRLGAVRWCSKSTYVERLNCHDDLTVIG